MSEPYDISEWPIRALSGDHDRSAFACGHESLDDYLRKFARHNQRSGVSRTYVVTEPGGSAARGYYSLSAGAIAFEVIPEDLRKRLPQYPLPSAHLGRLAVDRGFRGRRLGEMLLIDALRRVEVAADSIGIHAVAVRAIDEAARRFYIKYGFTALLDTPDHLLISRKRVRLLRLL